MAEKEHWFAQLTGKFSASIAHTFVIHGNTKDYVAVDDNYHPIQQALVHLFKKRDAVVFYNRSAGWRFRNDKERILVQNLLSDKPGAAGNALQAAMPKDVFPKAPAAAMPMFERLLTTGEGESAPKIALVIEYAESVFSAGKWDAAGANGELGTQIVTLMRWATDSNIAARNNPIILICADSLADLHPSLRSPESKIEPIYIPFPSREERLKFIQWYLLNKDVVMGDVTPAQLANATSSLSFTMIEDILLRSQAMGGLKLEYVKERKDEIVKAEFGDVLEIPEPLHGWETLGNFDYGIDFFNKCVLEPMRNGDTDSVPMGVILMGPPGTGKSIIGEALAYEAKFNFAKWSPGRSKGKYLGETDKNTERVFQAIESMMPCIVFIDEIDKAVMSEDAYDGDSGTSRSQLARIQDFTSDTRHRGKIIFIGATNRPDKMSAALKRAGRIGDKKIPVLATQNEAQCVDIFKKLFVKYGRQYKGGFNDVAKKIVGYVGADIESIVNKSFEFARDDKTKVVSEKHLAAAQACMLPSVSAKDIEFMTALAIKEVTDLTLLPPSYRKTVDLNKVNLLVDEFHQREAGGKREL